MLAEEKIAEVKELQEVVREVARDLADVGGKEGFITARMHLMSVVALLGAWLLHAANPPAPPDLEEAVRRYKVDDLPF